MKRGGVRSAGSGSVPFPCRYGVFGLRKSVVSSWRSSPGTGKAGAGRGSGDKLGTDSKCT